MKSIQRHLTLTLLTAVLALVAAADALVWSYARSRLTAEFDRALNAKARMVIGMVGEDRAGHLEFDATDVELADFRKGRGADYFEVWRMDGSVLVRSSSLAAIDLPRSAASRTGRARDIAIPGGGRGRAIEIQFNAHSDEDEEVKDRAGRAASPAPAPNAIIVLARNRRDLDGTLAVLTWSLLGTATIIAAGTIAGVMFSVRRGLLPLHQLGKEVDAVAADSLDQRFTIAGIPRELEPICQRLNNLLERLNAAFTRERRFTSDVAHELRTPIAELRTLTEIAIKWPDPAAASQSFRDALDIARHMENVIKTLLSIARTQAGVLPIQPQRIDLSAMLEVTWKPHEAIASEHCVSVDWQILPDVAVDADRSLLLGLLNNLFSNAVAYTPPGGRITGRLNRAGECIELQLANTCDGLGADDLPHLFEPFWRKDAARTGGANCGLGLSLAWVYATAMNASIKVEMPEPRIVRFTVSFPSAGWSVEKQLPIPWKFSRPTADKYV